MGVIHEYAGLSDAWRRTGVSKWCVTDSDYAKTRSVRVNLKYMKWTNLNASCVHPCSGRVAHNEDISLAERFTTCFPSFL